MQYGTLDDPQHTALLMDSEQTQQHNPPGDTPLQPTNDHYVAPQPPVATSYVNNHQPPPLLNYAPQKAELAAGVSVVDVPDHIAANGQTLEIKKVVDTMYVSTHYTPPPMRGPKPSVFGRGHRRFGGWCITPPGPGNKFVLTGAVLFPVVVFLVSVEDLSWWSFGITIVLTFFMLLNLLFATTCDPGILIPEQPDENKKSETLIINGTSITCKVCTTCHIVRPPRSGHCSTCDWCVEEFDHHCGVLGSCVAKRTFRFFAGFMWVGTVLAAWIVARSIVFYVHANYSDLAGTHGGRWRLVAAGGCILYAGIGGLILMSVGGMYCNLACVNSSQKEELALKRLKQDQYAVVSNPYNKGWLRNFYERILSPLPKSRIEAHMV